MSTENLGNPQASGILTHIVKDLHVIKRFIDHHQNQIDEAINIGTLVISIADPALAPVAQFVAGAIETLLAESAANVGSLDAGVESSTVVVRPLTMDASVVSSLRCLLSHRGVKASDVVQEEHH